VKSLREGEEKKEISLTHALTGDSNERAPEFGWSAESSVDARGEPTSERTAGKIFLRNKRRAVETSVLRFV